MSPILVRPVREQFEHDRIIRLLHSKSRRRYDAGMNPGAEQNVPVGSGAAAVFPDLVLHSPERGRRLEAIVEVETGESVNHLEALAEWAHFARLRTPFHLYVPAGMADVARQLCDDNRIVVTEMWSYHSIGDDVRFALIHRSKEAPVLAPLSRRTEKATPAESPAKRKPAAAAPAKTVKRAPAKPVPAKRAATRKAATKRAATRKAEPKRPAAKAKRPVAKPVKAAPKRKPAPAKKPAARPKKRK